MTPLRRHWYQIWPDDPKLHTYDVTGTKFDLKTPRWHNYDVIGTKSDLITHSDITSGKGYPSGPNAVQCVDQFSIGIPGDNVPEQDYTTMMSLVPSLILWPKMTQLWRHWYQVWPNDISSFTGVISGVTKCLTGCMTTLLFEFLQAFLWMNIMWSQSWQLREP